MVRRGSARAAARRVLVAIITLALTSPFLTQASGVAACGQPTTWSLASTFDIVANGLAPQSYPQLSGGTGPQSIPPSLLKAVGWVESGWRQFQETDRPLVSYDFGYGIMQITSGMAGAYGNPGGDLDTTMQSKIASDPEYNIAYGAVMLAAKWDATPVVGNRDPSTIEDWYYALWAYNGWGWANNPNNPRFSRHGTPATNPVNFPYQERVLYFVAHPPRDAQGNPLWEPVPVTLPSPKAIETNPGPLTLATTHQQPVAALSAVYKPASPSPLHVGASETLSVSVRNTGTATWQPSGPAAVSLAYALQPAAAQGGSDPSTATSAEEGSSILPRSVPPGTWTHIKVKITAPSPAGTYTVQWDLQKSDGTRFSESGVPPRREPLIVNAAGMAPTPLPHPTAAPGDPAEGLRYVADTAASDGTNLKPGQAFVKGWLVFNNGKDAWTSDWKLQQISGTRMGATTASIPSTAPCHSANILVSLHAPKVPGNYHSTWQLQDPTSQAIGDTLTIVVVVPAPPTSTPTPTPQPGTPTPTSSPATPTPTPVG